MNATRPRLPPGWRWVILGEVCEVVTGGTPPRAQSRFFGGNIPWVKPDDLAQAMFIDTTDEYLTEDGVTATRPIPRGSIMVSCIGKLGKCAVAARRLATNQQINSLIPGPEVDSTYLYHACKTLKPQLESAASTSLIPIVNKTAFAGLVIPLPSLPEQRRIAAILNEQMAAVQRARAAAEEQLQAAKALPAAYLHWVFPQPGQELPAGWHWVPLGELCEFKRGPFGSSLKKEIFVPDGYKVYEQKHAIRDSFSIGSYFIDEKKFREMTEFSVRPGDLIVSCSGTMGRVAIVPVDAQPGIVNQALLKLTPRLGTVDPRYLRDYLHCESVQTGYFRHTAGAAIQNVASVLVLKGIPIPLPPLFEQKRIAALVAEQVATAEELRAGLAAQLDEINALPAALLRRAFRGEL